ncbi:hypothetical protein POTOM_019100 [Populus tomentosa]|uniref:AMP-dependent synthetase/ligase domain-containing protein n=2 Tax=Populus TaxID=3689 RepID=A0A8X7ZWN8_POPTO|nr:hypothetical protein POTOM_019100 [Populus tomentosa]
MIHRGRGIIKCVNYNIPRETSEMEGIYHCPANYVPLSPISFLERAATVYGDKVSIVYGSNVRFSWKDTFDRCVKVASALVQLKICPGDIVSFALHT